MKTDELHNELDLIAGTPPPATDGGLHGVYRRARLARVRTSMIACVALVAVVAVLVVALNSGSSSPHVETPAGTGLSTPNTSVVPAEGQGAIPEHPVETCVTFERDIFKSVDANDQIFVYDRGVGYPIHMDVTTFCTGSVEVQKAARAAGQPDPSVYVENGQVRGEQMPTTTTP